MPMTTTSRSRPRSWAASNLEADRSWSRIREKDGITYGPDGEVVKRFGFHRFRHSLATCWMDEQENPAVVQAIMHVDESPKDQNRSLTPQPVPGLLVIPFRRRREVLRPW